MVKFNGVVNSISTDFLTNGIVVSIVCLIIGIIFYTFKKKGR